MDNRARNVDGIEGIPFTQYLMPDGEQRAIWMPDRSTEVNKKAQQIIDALFRFECEVLSTGHVSLTVSDDFGDYSTRVVRNSPGVALEVDKLILEFDIAKQLEERKLKV